MAKATIGFGILLIVVGSWGFFATGSQHPTALIPAYFGFVLFWSGVLAIKPERRALWMHIAVTVGLLGFLGAAVQAIREYVAAHGELVGTRRAYTLTRWKNVLVSTLIYQLSQRRPQMMRRWIRGMTVKQLPAGYDVDTHFKPVYGPWDQRLCLIPDGDLFRAIREQQASVVTGKIATFTEHGIQMESGAEVEADIVVTATGLQLLALGGLQLTVDGRDVQLPETMAYKGTMLSGVPNFALTIGYTNASWTLKADLVSDYVCRLLRYMDRHGYDVCVPVNDDPDVAERPLLDFAAGYILRSMHEFPKSGSRAPWRLGMSYLNDAVMLRHGRIDDGVLRFSRRGAGVARAAKELVR